MLSRDLASGAISSSTHLGEITTGSAYRMIDLHVFKVGSKLMTETQIELIGDELTGGVSVVHAKQTQKYGLHVIDCPKKLDAYPNQPIEGELSPYQVLLSLRKARALSARRKS